MATKELPTYPHQKFRMVTTRVGKKARVLCEPSLETMAVHRQALEIFDQLLGNNDVPFNTLGTTFPHNVVGSVALRGMMAGIFPHRDNKSRYFYMTDLKDAFPSVDVDLALDTLHSFLPDETPTESHNQIDRFVREWATTYLVNGLPLGAPASPFLFNVSLLPVDDALIDYCALRGIIYTRYLDDLVFSSRQQISNSKRRQIRTIIEELPGAKINHAKSRVHSLDFGPVTITGVSLYPDGHVLPAPKTLQKIDSVCTRIENFLETGALPKPLNESHRRRLCGLEDADPVYHQYPTKGPNYVQDWLFTARDIVNGYIGALEMVVESRDLQTKTSRDVNRRLRSLSRKLDHHYKIQCGM